MGLLDKMGAGAGGGIISHTGAHYDAVVNKGSLNMGRFTSELNSRWDSGWRLAHVIEQAGNTVMVYERRD